MAIAHRNNAESGIFILQLPGGAMAGLTTANRRDVSQRISQRSSESPTRWLQVVLIWFDFAYFHRHRTDRHAEKNSQIVGHRHQALISVCFRAACSCLSATTVIGSRSSP